MIDTIDITKCKRRDATRLDKQVRDALAEARLLKALGEEERDDDEPDDLIAEGGKGDGERERLSHDCGSQREERPRTHGQRLQDQACIHAHVSDVRGV